MRSLEEHGFHVCERCSAHAGWRVEAVSWLLVGGE
jgi:hypothetical protein